MDLARQREWGPSPSKVSWTEYCQRKIDADPDYAHKISNGSPDSLFMSDDIINLVSSESGRNYGPYRQKTAMTMIKLLRPEDAIHIPHVRFDHETGKIIDWNRSMCDLTGISAAQVVGKSYAEVLEEYCPSLSKKYKNAAVEWVKKSEDKQSEYIKPEDLREDYLFPLPLPVKYKLSFKYTSNPRKYDEYVELLAARADRLFDVYPDFTSYKGVPQYKWDEVQRKNVWNFDTSGWVGGMEFTLRRKEHLPSLQSLCREILPKDQHALNQDGSLAVAKASLKTSDDDSIATNDTLSVIADYVKTCGPDGVRYIREVIHAVNKRFRDRNGSLRNKTFHFTTDWSSHTETSDIHKHVVGALGGAAFIVEKVGKDKVTWNLNFDALVNGVEEPFMRQWKPKEVIDYRARVMNGNWKAFMENIAPVLRENKHAIVTCGATDSTSVLPVVDRPERAVLTLKIDGYVRTDGSYREEKFKAHATVQVPASLNFFQLHRVVCLTMNNRSSGRRETHEWRVPNQASKYERPFSNGHFEYVQLGETYFVENGRREDYGFAATELFDTGAAIRQRVSLTGAYVDQDMPLNFYGDHGSDYSGSELNRDDEQIKACIHSTCISSTFFQPGAYAVLQDGLVKYSTTYKITCMKIEKYEGPLSLNPNINIMQPKCLRGKPEDGDTYWSVKRANAELHYDRGCLRRNLCKIGSDDYMVQMPWCGLKANPIRPWGYTKNTKHIPAAADLTGLDGTPIFLNGEPPLPSSEDYDTYVSSLRGKIDPDFLPENVADEFGSFSVPFGRRPRHDRFSSEAEVTENQTKIGDVWTREVDDEVKRIDSLQPKKEKKAGKKRKALMNLN